MRRFYSLVQWDEDGTDPLACAEYEADLRARDAQREEIERAAERRRTDDGSMFSALYESEMWR